MRSIHALLAALAMMTAPLHASAQDTFAPDSLIDAILASRLEQKRGTGFVVAVLEKGKLPRIRTAGSSGVDGLPLDASTVFEIGSITKVFTAVLLADMAARGELSLDDPIARYLPKNVRVPSRSGREITLRDLATQRSGLPRLPTNLHYTSIANPYADYTVENLYDFLRSYTLARDIGSQYEYSNLGYGLLGHVLSLRGGKSYEELLTERVLAPLGMTETAITLTPAMQTRMATGFNAEGAAVPLWAMPTLGAAGGLKSTAGDMLKFLAATIDTTVSPVGRAIAAAKRMQAPADRPANGVGLGWHIVDVFGTTITWHNGGTGGFRAFIGVDDMRQRGVILLSNSSVSPDDIVFHLIEPKVPLDIPAAPPKPRTAIALDPSKLDRLVGVYELAPAFRIAITKEGSSLFGQATGQGKVQLHAESETMFFLREVDAQIAFAVRPDGTVNEIVLHQNGAKIPGRRVQ